MLSIILLLSSTLIPSVGQSSSSFTSGLESTRQEKDSAPKKDENSITLVVRYSQDKKKIVKGIPYQKKMTVLDAMKFALKNKKIKFSFRGKNETAFLTEIDGIKNQGARGDNWIFRINDKLGKKSFGVSEIKAGDSVSWTFGKYKP